MNTTTSNMAFACRTAFALNNMAVTLMKKKCYELAVQTTNDSLSMIKRAFNTCDETTCSNDTFNTAYRRCAHTLNEVDEPNSSCEVDIRILDHDDCRDLQASATYGPTSSIAFLVRICKSWTWEERDSAEITQQLGIILYNHGIACFLVSRQRMEGKNGKYLQKASKFLQLAETTFSTLLELQREDRHGFSTHVFLLSIVLNCFAVVLATQQRQLKAQSTLNAVSLLRSSVEEDCSTWFTLIHESAAAA